MNSPRVAPPRQQTGHPIRDSALGRVPATIDAFIDLQLSVWREGPLPPALLELARLTNARHVRCIICQSLRYDLAREDGLTEHKVALIDQPDSEELSPREQTVIALTQALLTRPDGAHSELRARLAQQFSPEEQAQLTLAIGVFNAFSKCAVALGGMPESLPVTEVSLMDRDPSGGG